MKVMIVDDMVFEASGDMGVEVPENFAGILASQLRFVRNKFVDASTLSTFHVDISGTKHATGGDGRQSLKCAWDDVLKYEGGTWRVRVSSDDAIEQWDFTRRRRNALLTASDWTQIPDAPLSEEQRAAWASYRQALRDITETSNSPDEISWPAPPA